MIYILKSMIKAWNDIVNDSNKSICWTNDSEWFVDMGIKIEVFKNGNVEIKNTMLSPDHYKDVTPIQRQLFEQNGWEYGCLSVCIDTFTLAVNRLNVRIRNAVNANRVQDIEDFTNRRDKLLKKIFKYSTRLNKIM